MASPSDSGIPVDDHTTGRLESVNIGEIREVEHQGRVVTTGIFKTPTAERQTVAGVHVGEDLQADTAAHGGPDKAIYAYAAEDYDWWADELDREAPPGWFGENLTTRGLDVSGAKVGDRWHIGTTVLEVAEPRVPCFKLGIATGVPRIQQRFSKADRPGAYLRIIESGELGTGDAIRVEPTADRSISVAEVAVVFHRDRHDARRLLDVARLSAAWKRWARDRIERDAP